MFSFYMWVWKNDCDLAIRLVKSLRLLYPDNEIIIISDGSIPEVTISFFLTLGVVFYEDDHEKWLSNGDKFLFNRYRKLLELSTSELFVKLDPDSQIHKQFTIPDSNWFGQVFTDKVGTGTWGCGMGISRKLITELVNTPQENTDFKYFPVNGEMLVSEDSTLCYYLNKLGYYPTTWSDVSVKRLPHVGLLNSGYAITHPSFGKRIRETLPLAVLIETQSNCNRRCSFCKHGQVTESITNQLSWEQLNKIATELAEINFDRRISLFGINEPLLDKRIIDITKLFRSKCPKAFISIVTNGDHLTQQLLEDLYDNGMSKIGISIYEDINYKKWKDNKQVKLIDMRNPNLENRAGSLVDLEHEQLNTPCNRPNTMLTIKATGKVVLCCSDMYGDYEMGNINTTNVIDIWYSDKFLDYREQLLLSRSGINPCQNCSYTGQPASRYYP